MSNEEELYHYGIKDMKWYVRRYQNPDGTLTELGRKRYGKNAKSYAKLQKHVENADRHWYEKKGNKIQKRVADQSKREADRYARDNIYPKYAKSIKKGLKTGDTSNSKKYAFEYNQKLAELMTEKASKYSSASGKALTFVAKASTYEMGNNAIFMNLVWQGQQSVASVYTRGIREDGRAAYKKDTVEIKNIDVDENKKR